MEKTGQSSDSRLARLDALMQGGQLSNSESKLDFSDTQIAFEHLTNRDLKRAIWLFRMMNKRWLVNLGSNLALIAVKLRLPFVESIIKATLFEQFVVGTSLFDSQRKINRLNQFNTNSILDYGAEGKETEEDFNLTMNENIRAIEFASQNESIPCISTKITGIARFGLLEKIQAEQSFSEETHQEYRNVIKRLDSICHTARKRGISVYIDAEESWIQDSIDHLVNMMMRRYNKEKVVVYNTFQMYRKDRLQYLINSFNTAREEGYLLGAKLVRGAYMEKERERAARFGYSSPILDTKDAVDDSFNTGLRFCLDNYEHIAVSNSSHNAASNQLMADLITQKQLSKDHSHLYFCQLYGMSDNLTFNLAKSGFNVAKYVVYGPVRDVVPYLIRRAKENSSVTGDVSRELNLLLQEKKRRANQ